jgi:hypothetical protein
MCASQFGAASGSSLDVTRSAAASAADQEARPTGLGRALIIIERRVTSGTVRAFGFHKDIIRVPWGEISALLTYLRQFAPQALGPPQRVRRTRTAKPPA